MPAPAIVTTLGANRQQLESLTRILKNLGRMHADGWQAHEIASYLANERADLAVLAMEIDLALYC